MGWGITKRVKGEGHPYAALWDLVVPLRSPVRGGKPRERLQQRVMVSDLC